MLIHVRAGFSITYSTITEFHFYCNVMSANTNTANTDRYSTRTRTRSLSGSFFLAIQLHMFDYSYSCFRSSLLLPILEFSSPAQMFKIVWEIVALSHSTPLISLCSAFHLNTFLFFSFLFYATCFNYTFLARRVCYCKTNTERELVCQTRTL